MTYVWLFLIVPGMICAYAIVLRPLLHRIPTMAKFYADADGFWAKVWAVCGKSATIVWSYIVGGIGGVLALMNPIANTLGDPNFKDQVTTALQGNPKILGYFAISVSVITIIARLRSLGRAA